ncbi:MAG: 4-alpha-glucanotransferase [Candidatus Tectimicrobiota bacterium]|nr:MAG: 4-alpha-glucanotransferase [Candidatus Tectomicrobia bacterium]
MTMQRRGLVLSQLAALYGVQTAYYDVTRRRRQAKPEALLAVLRLLGAPLHGERDLAEALRARRQALWQRGLPPVSVVWASRPAEVALRLPAKAAQGPLRYRLELEDGTVQEAPVAGDRLRQLAAADVEGVVYLDTRFSLPAALPWGYHRLHVEAGAHRYETRLLVAPLHAYTGEAPLRTWGVFLPLYALHTQRSLGSGDFTDLAALLRWVGEQGGGVVATLPLLAAFLDTPYDPSPYAPASRLFWNEFYVDVTRLPGLEGCPAAQQRLASAATQETIAALRRAPLVDYRRLMALKRQVLETVAGHFFATMAAQHRDFQDYLATHPLVEDYARFRAVGERQGCPWPAWPAPQRDGVLRPGDYDEAARQYHLYAQWVAHTQLRTLAAAGRAQGVQLYLDLPLGVHADSYDVWRHRALFVRDAAVGAPPDTFFTKGQNWGFPPLHPEALRAQHYHYFIAYLRHQLRHTGLLRLDHVMSLHRLFWIPHGVEARHGVYVRYPAAELYAIVTLESHRHRVRVVGEDLGTVPPYVTAAMRQHRLYRMYVVQYQLRPQARYALRPVPQHAVASLNTHDMPPFAAFWQGLDLKERLALGLLRPSQLSQERRQRRQLRQALQAFLRQRGWLDTEDEAPLATLQACLAFLGASAAQVVLVTLEDLWLETAPQNVPGTFRERPNWQRKARYSLEALQQLPQVQTTLATLNRLRPRGEP